MSFNIDNTLTSQNNVFAAALPKPLPLSDFKESPDRAVNLRVANSLIRENVILPKPSKSKSSKAAPVVYIVEDGLMGDNGVIESQEGVSEHIELVAASAKASEPGVTVVKFDLPGDERIEAQDHILGNYHLAHDWDEFYDSVEGRGYRHRIFQAKFGGYKDGYNKLRERLKPGDVVSLSDSETIEIASLRKLPGLEDLSKDNVEEKAEEIIQALEEVAYSRDDTDLTGLYERMQDSEGGGDMRYELTAGEVRTVLENRAAIEQIARQGNRVFIAAGNTSDGKRDAYFNIYGLMPADVSPSVVVVSINAEYGIMNNTVDIVGKAADEGAGEVRWDKAGRPQWHFRGARVPLPPASGITKYRISKLADEQRKAIGDFSASAPALSRPTSPSKSWDNFNKAVIELWNRSGVRPGVYRVDDLFSFLQDKKGFACDLVEFTGDSYREIKPLPFKGTSLITPWEAAKDAVRQSGN